MQTRKIKAKWKAEKRREGIQPSTALALETPVSSVSGIPAGKKPNHLYQSQPIDVDTRPDAPPSISEERPVKVSIPRTTGEPTRTSKSDHLRDRHGKRIAGQDVLKARDQPCEIG